MIDLDYRAGAKINIFDISDGFRISSEISKEDSEMWSKIITQFGSQYSRDGYKSWGINIGNIKIWLTGFLEYVGPPERHPDLKYQK